ncbi:MAG: AmmeMemoRadiSam system radical SAM enzyme [Anaerolineae bacterium]|nr:AmmeMemoRadiSam system radical SAM enzyme [Anaerolineae bacterium]
MATEPRRHLTRREFLRRLGLLGGAALGTAAGLAGRRWWEWAPHPAEPSTPEPLPQWAVEARYYAALNMVESLDCAACHGDIETPAPVSYCHTPHTGAFVQCQLCPHKCVLADGERGLCRARENRGGVLYSLSYGNPCAIHVDPIEKKPLFHFLPTATAFSLATGGCALRCLYCQNWTISQTPPDQTEFVWLPPDAVVSAALESQAPVIAYTYSEPTAFYEYMLDSALAGRRAGLRSVVISSGYINEAPLRELCETVDAIKIDLKGFNEDFYQKVCGAHLDPVLNTLRVIAGMGVHLEIVNLVVPTLNDADDDLRALVDWVLDALGADVPLHFTRFQPNYKLTNVPATPVETLTAAWEMARARGVRYAYVGNVPGHAGNHTYCPACGEIVIQREGFAVTAYHLKDGACEFCGQAIAGIWQDASGQNATG